MVAEAQDMRPVSAVTAGRRFLVGTNVIVATLLVVGVVVVAQLIAYRLPSRWDMTSSGVNSLNEGSENLLRSLDTGIRLTSLYFETDREEEDQPRYRRAAQDLLGLYEATNRAKVRTEWINPLKDHEKFRKLLARLREKASFKEEIEGYQARLDEYAEVLDPKVRDLVQSELDEIAAMGGAIGESSTQASIAPVEDVFARLNGTFESTRQRIDALTYGDNLQYSAAVNELGRLYRDVSKWLTDIGKYGAEQAQRDTGLSAEQAEFLREAGNRYAEVVAAIEEETTKLQDLEPLEFDELAAQLAPTTNPILVETEDDAMVVDFSSVWPPLDQNMGPRAGFEKRAFKGEEKLTSAILRATHKEQTAVVFVRYGGTPLFMGGFMRGQPPSPYAAMKQ
ncbi:MAG: Gldg family protein, partial [Phycisphaerae bacterium]